MKKVLFKISIILFSLILMTSIILPENNANADSNQSNTPNEIGKKVGGDFNKLDDEQSSKELSYILNNVFIYDEEGNISDVNTEKSIERYGYVPKEIQEIKDSVDNKTTPESQKGFQTEAGYKNSNQCFYGEMQNNFADLIPTSVLGAFLEEASSGQIKKATALKLLKAAGKAGVKGNIYSLAAQIVWTNEKCNWQYPSINT